MPRDWTSDSCIREDHRIGETVRHLLGGQWLSERESFVVEDIPCTVLSCAYKYLESMQELGELSPMIR